MGEDTPKQRHQHRVCDPLVAEDLVGQLRRGYRSRILSVSDDEGVLLGIAPLMARDGALTFLGDRDLSDYFDFIVSRQHASRFYPALCEYLQELEWKTLDLHSVPTARNARTPAAPSEGEGLECRDRTGADDPLRDTAGYLGRISLQAKKKGQARAASKAQKAGARGEPSPVRRV